MSTQAPGYSSSRVDSAHLNAQRARPHPTPQTATNMFTSPRSTSSVTELHSSRSSTGFSIVPVSKLAKNEDDWNRFRRGLHALGAAGSGYGNSVTRKHLSMLTARDQSILMATCLANGMISISAELCAFALEHYGIVMGEIEQLPSVKFAKALHYSTRAPTYLASTRTPTTGCTEIWTARVQLALRPPSPPG